MSHGDIGRELHIPHRTVSDFLHRLDERGTADNIPRSGRPRATSASQDQLIIQTAKANTRIPLAELCNITNIEASLSTIRRRLQEVHIRKWRAVDRPALTAVHAEKRLNWALEQQRWREEKWKKVIWSDESAIQKDSDNRQVWIFRHQNKQEKYAPENVRGRTKYGNLSQMVWGSFCGTKLGPIVFIEGMINSDVYISVLEQHLLPYIDALRGEDTTNIVFQQDNARPHASKKTHKWLEDAMEKHEFVLMEWPPNSPDMNPIEHLWEHIKTELHRRYPDTKDLQGSPDVIRATLRARLAEIWWDIGEEVLDRLIKSMPNRVKALIDADGWYTEY